jgi:signal transduction histidine kinase
LLIYAWPADLLPHAAFYGATPQGPWAITRVAAALAVGMGYGARRLAAIADPESRRRALLALAASHLWFGGLFFLQWYALLDGVLSSLVGWGPLLVGGILWYAANGSDTTRVVVHRLIAPADARDLHAPMRAIADWRRVSVLQSEYEAQLQHAARQEERRRLARDLHDAVKQQLFVIRMAAATAEVRFDTDADGARAALAQVLTATRDAMTEMTALIEQLQTTPIENVELASALKQQCDALAIRTGARIRCDVGALPPSQTLPLGAQSGLFRCAQEALANIGRHARATEVDVTLASNMQQMALTIRDNGAGFDPFAVVRGMGLENMKARAADAGGTFTITSAPGRGTTVEVAVPYATRSFAHYAARASVWVAVLGAATWYVVHAGIETHPVVLGGAILASVASSRYMMALIRLHRTDRITA